MRARGVGTGSDWAAGAAVVAAAPAMPRADATISADPANRLATRFCMLLPRRMHRAPDRRCCHRRISVTTLGEIVVLAQVNPGKSAVPGLATTLPARCVRVDGVVHVPREPGFDVVVGLDEPGIRHVD